MRQYLVMTLVLLFFCSFKSDKPAYVLFNSQGKEIKYHHLLEMAKEADVILFGELHNNPIVHWLEQELTRDLYADKKEKLVLGAEMFESDDQIIVDEYLGGFITEKTMNDAWKYWTASMQGLKSGSLRSPLCMTVHLPVTAIFSNRHMAMGEKTCPNHRQLKMRRWLILSSRTGQQEKQ